MVTARRACMAHSEARDRARSQARWQILANGCHSIWSIVNVPEIPARPSEEVSRMSTRRMFTALAGAVLIAGSLPACSADDGSAGSGAGKAINVLIGANTIYPDEQRQWFTQVSDRFAKENGGATVKFETFASPNDELTRIQTSVLSGQGPDIYALGTTFTPTAYATKAFVELTKEDWDKVGGRDRFLPATLGISGPDAQHEVGIPFATRPFVMAYNRELLAKAGIEKPADSWDGLREQAKKLTGGGGYGLAIGYADTFDPW